MAEPNAADWLTAIGTVGTLAATVCLFWLDRFQQRKRQYRAQAVLISGWTDSVKADEKTRDIHVTNMSDEPVYNVNIFLQDENVTDDKNDILPQRILGNTRFVNKRFLSVLPPKQQVTWTVARKDPAYEGPNSVPLVGLLFNDKNSVRWFRDWDGAISSVDRKEYASDVYRAAKRSNDIDPSGRKSIG